MSDLPAVVIKAGREKKIRARYPWVQREEVVRADRCEPGGLARLFDHQNEFLAIGTFNPKSRFPFRVLSLVDEPIDEDWFRVRMQQCAERRSGIEGCDSKRLIFSEADGLPGLIVDSYPGVLVVQVRSAGMEHLKPIWLPALQHVWQCRAVYERSEMEGRSEEGLGPFAGLLSGEMPNSIVATEDGLKMEVPVVAGLKTGHYVDQRPTRRRLAARVGPNADVLDTFCYTGGFSLYAARAGARTLGVDLNETAIDLALSNAERNGLAERCEFICRNAFEFLAEPPQRKFDWIVLDPPAIAKKSDKRDSLKWGVWKLVFNAVDHLNPGGRLIVCSCSYQLGLSELLDTIRLAASDKGKAAFLEEVTIQGEDHPYLLQFPESLYLKCAWVRIE